MTHNDEASPKDRRRERTRKEILRAAAQVFAKKGFHEASIQDIAAVAEFSTGSLYNYFDNKDALFLDLLDDAFGNFQDWLVPLDDPRPWPQRLRAQIEALFGFGEQHHDHFRLFVVLTWSEAFCLGREIDNRMKKKRMLLGMHLMQMVQSAIERGELPPQNAEHGAVLIVSTLIGFAFRWFHGLGPEQLTDDIDVVLGLVLNGLRAPEVEEPI